jgi:hypothetical protein
VVVLAGHNDVLPLTGTVWKLAPCPTLASVAPVVVQARVEQEPAAMLEGLAVKLTMTIGAVGGGVGGGGVGGVGVVGTGGGAAAET